MKTMERCLVELKKHILKRKSHLISLFSCRLYPIRIKEYSEFTAVNYHNWSICSDACILGEELKKPVFRICKRSASKKIWKRMVFGA